MYIGKSTLVYKLYKVTFLDNRIKIGTILYNKEHNEEWVITRYMWGHRWGHVWEIQCDGVIKYVTESTILNTKCYTIGSMGKAIYGE